MKKFNPFPLLKSGQMQTIASQYIPPGPIVSPSNRYTVELPDGDKLIMTENRPASWNNGDRIILMMHGLAGSEDSNYMIRIGRKLYNQGYMVLKLNLRSCGPGLGLATKPYHSGRSEDARAALNCIAEKFSISPVTLVGFSLSANITLKMLGEDGGNQIGNLKNAVAVSPPLDLEKTAFKIQHSAFGIYNRFFTKKLINHVRQVESIFPEMQKTVFSKEADIIEFDNVYTGPQCGFKDGLDYYTQCSGKNFIKSINTPTLLLYSTDDPVVDNSFAHNEPLPKCIQKIETTSGGHVGYIGLTGNWMDNTIIHWINNN